METLEGRQLMASVAAVTGLSLINADSDQVVAANLTNGATLNLATLSTRNLSIRADMGDGEHQSVKFVLDGTTVGTESVAPYAIAGNDKDDYFAWTPSVGSHTLSVTPYVDNGAHGEAGDTHTVTFNVVDQPAAEWSQQAAVTLSLINADTDEVLVADLTNGATIDFTKIGTKNLSIRATMADGSVESVKFELDGVVTQVENYAHYAINGNTGNDYWNWTPSLGAHVLTVTGYSQDKAQGEAGATKTIKFNVVQSAQAQPSEVPTPAPAPAPTPAPTPAPAPVIDGNDDTGTDNTGDFNAPVPVIQHTTDRTVNAGQAVHVSGTLSSVNVGEVQNATFEWDFGDTGSKYNVTRGFNAAHVYTKPGTYTIKLTVTNSAGKVASKTTTVNVTAANRKVIYVSNSGSDSNDGSSASSAIRSFDKAASMVGDNTEILFRRGDTFTTDNGMSITSDNVVVGAYGDGSAPVIKYDGPRSYRCLISTHASSENVAIRGLVFDSIYDDSSIKFETNMPIAIKPSGTNTSVQNCTFLNLGYAINSNSEPTGLLVQDSSAPSKTALRGYFVWADGQDHAYYGNSAANSGQHIIRVSGADRVAIAHNNFSNPDEDGTTRGTLTIQRGTYVYVYANQLSEGKVTIGPLGESDGLSAPESRWRYGTFDSNMINSYMIIEHGAEDIAVRNNVINADRSFALQIEGYNSTYGRGVKDVTIEGNTGLNDSTMGSFLYVTGKAEDIVVTNNLYVAPNLEAGSYKSAGLRTNSYDLSAFTLISGNIWPDAETVGRADGTNLVGSTESSSTYQTASEWESWSVVKGDMFKDVALSTNSFQVSLGGITAGSSLKLAA